MKHEYVENIYDLMEYAKKIDFFNMTSREFRDFEVEISEAVEKQVPVKPMSEITEIGGLQHICKSCWGFIGYLHEYCENCGQAIKWEVEE